MLSLYTHTPPDNVLVIKMMKYLQYMSFYSYIAGMGWRVLLLYHRTARTISQEAILAWPSTKTFALGVCGPHWNVQGGKVWEPLVEYIVIIYPIGMSGRASQPRCCSCWTFVWRSPRREWRAPSMCTWAPLCWCGSTRASTCTPAPLKQWLSENTRELTSTIETSATHTVNRAWPQNHGSKS